jgi:soluble lytic murein transglycosylase
MRRGTARTARVPSPAPARRRRGLRLVGLGLLALLAGVLVLRPLVNEAVKEITLPLRHEDIIRQQARDKNLDPALIAAIIYRESRFRDQTSHAGAKGLMQILPSTADFIARQSGGTEFEHGDLANPQINIAYGSWYLRYLVERYDGNTTAAVAAYNAGETKVNEWGGASLEIDGIRFLETRQYTLDVLEKETEYRRRYAKELGLR